MDLGQLYAALEEADKRAQAGDAQAKLDAAELASMIQQYQESSTSEPDYVSPIVPALAIGIASGAKGAANMIPTSNNVAKAMQQNAPSVPAPKTMFNPRGVSVEQSVDNWRNYSEAQNEAAKGIRRDTSLAKKYPNFQRNPLPITPETTDARNLARQKIGAGLESTGKFANRVPGVNVAGGAMAGYQGADAYNRFQQGDVAGGAVSTAGSGSSAVATMLGKSNPRLRALGLIGGAVAPLVNRGIDSLREEKAMGGPVGYAGGKAVKGGLEAANQMLKRAPKKSEKETYEIAQRMAPQQLNEFVRAPGKTTSVAGKSLKQFQHEKNLKHDIVPGLRNEYSLDNLKPIDWNAQKGGVSLILPGDASGVDTIRGIAGKKLANDSVQEGGFPFALKFAQENPDVDPELWSSTGRAAKGYFDLGKRVSEQYGTQNILPTYSKMPDGMEYALHFNDALRQGLKPNKADIRKLDNIMRQGQFKGHTFEDFKGFGDDDFVTEYMKRRPEFRKHFGSRMQVQEVLKEIGLPPTYGMDVMHAVTRPELRNVETGAGGNLIGRLDLNRPKLSQSSHGTYENKYRDPGFNIPGEVVGKTKYITPYDMMYPDSLMAVKANPKQAPQEFGSLKLTGGRQIIDNQHIDEMGMYDEAMKKLVGYAAGSSVKKAVQSGLGALKSKEEFKNQFTPGFYHGSPSNKIKEFDSKKGFLSGVKEEDKTIPNVTFVSPDPKFAESFLPEGFNSSYKTGSTMYPVSVNMGKHFNPKEEIGEKVIREYAGNTPLAQQMSKGNWSMLESPDFIKHLQNKGFDSMTVIEGGVPNVAVFDSKNIRGKFAKYNPEDADSADFMKAEGGPVGYAAGKKVIDATRKLILPPAENAARTQIIGTMPTYEKAANIFQQQGGAGRGIDFGAGLGQGAKALGKDFDTYEPFAQNWKPTYSNAADVPSDEYGRLTNLNVLNVVPREMRDEIVQDIGRVMQPGGMGIITTRGKDVMNAKGAAGPEPMSVITSRDTYQKGFNKDELEEYLKYMLGDKFDINRLNLGPAGALIKKKAEGGLV